jgi:hypothetical protein
MPEFRLSATSICSDEVELNVHWRIYGIANTVAVFGWIEVCNARNKRLFAPKSCGSMVVARGSGDVMGFDTASSGIGQYVVNQN